jgi:hypothetical protein
VLLFGVFFVLFRRVIGSVGAHRFWRVGIWIYISLVLALIGYATAKGDWFSVRTFVVLGESPSIRHITGCDAQNRDPAARLGKGGGVR